MTEGPAFNWPEGATVAVSLTFDVDADSGFLGDSPTYARRLTSLSEARFGVVRGMPRIISLLERHDLDASFFVPGHTAATYPEVVPMILEDGHEVGHHGHIHLRTDKVSTADAARGARAGLRGAGGGGSAPPAGYRSPAWEMTPETLRMLVDAGFAYDSSCMGDDRPYVEDLRGHVHPRAAGALVARRLAALRLVDRPWRQRRPTRASCTTRGSPSTERRGTTVAT